LTAEECPIIIPDDDNASAISCYGLLDLRADDLFPVVMECEIYRHGRRILRELYGWTVSVLL